MMKIAKSLGITAFSWSSMLPTQRVAQRFKRYRVAYRNRLVKVNNAIKSGHSIVEIIATIVLFQSRAPSILSCYNIKQCLIYTQKLPAVARSHLKSKY